MKGGLLRPVGKNIVAHHEKKQHETELKNKRKKQDKRNLTSENKVTYELSDKVSLTFMQKKRK